MLDGRMFAWLYGEKWALCILVEHSYRESSSTHFDLEPIRALLINEAEGTWMVTTATDCLGTMADYKPGSCPLLCSAPPLLVSGPRTVSVGKSRAISVRDLNQKSNKQ